MIKWLWKNKEWVFSGIGVFALSAFLFTQKSELPPQINQTQESGDSSTQIQSADGDIYFNSAPDK